MNNSICSQMTKTRSANGMATEVTGELLRVRKVRGKVITISHMIFS